MMQVELKWQIVFHDCSRAPVELSNGLIVRRPIPIVAIPRRQSVSYLLFIYVRLRESPPIPPEADFR